MSLSQSVAEVIRHHVTLELESLDRMYLNVYVPRLQSEGGVVGFLILGVSIALNAGFGQKYYYWETPWELHAGVFVAGWILLLIWARRRRNRR